ncbi:DUF1330 domain-containing protein [Leptospira interrogans]
MAKAYWIATYRSITNPAAVEAYAAKTGPMIRAAGGRILVRGIPAEVFEDGQRLRTVVIEFESVPAAIATYNDPAYQDCVKLLRDAVVRDIRIVEAAG